MKYLYLPKNIKRNRGVLNERAHYYTILIEGVCTIREGVQNEEGALTEVVRYLWNCSIYISQCKIYKADIARDFQAILTSCWPSLITTHIFGGRKCCF